MKPKKFSGDYGVSNIVSKPYKVEKGKTFDITRINAVPGSDVVKMTDWYAWLKEIRKEEEGGQ